MKLELAYMFLFWCVMMLGGWLVGPRHFSLCESVVMLVAFCGLPVADLLWGVFFPPPPRS